MKINFEKILVVIISLISMVIIYKIPKLLINKNNKVPEVKLREIKNSKAFAIMIQNETGYEEYNKDTWPTEGYKFKEAKCIDNNGMLVDNVISFDSKTGKITLTTNHTVFCTLYFEKSLIGKLRENDFNKVLSNEEIGGMYRYQGVGKKENIDDTHRLVDNNYICFGTTNKEECIIDKEKYMYRIIGITKNNQMKLIKMQNIEDGDISQFVWNNIYLKEDCGDDKCVWPASLLYKRLNGLSNGDVIASGTIADGGNDDIFIDNPNYDYLRSGDNINGGNTPSDWYNLISQFNWKYGYIVPYVTENIDDTIVYGMLNNGNIVYQIETGQLPAIACSGDNKIKYLWTDEITAKIGLMYLHDYFLAYDNNRYWYGYTSLSDVQSEDFNWIFIGNNNTTAKEEWMISTYGPNNYFGNSAYFVASHGHPTINDKTFESTLAVRPTFYLIDSVKITGSGTEDNPYLIAF